MPVEVILIFVAKAALSGGTGTVGKAIVNAGLARLDRALRGGNRERLIGHTADAILSLHDTRGDRLPNVPVRTELVWLIDQLDRRTPPAHVHVGPAKVENAAPWPGDGADGVASTDLARRSTPVTPDEAGLDEHEVESYWLYPVAIWLVNMTRHADEVKGLAPPFGVRASTALQDRRGWWKRAGGLLGARKRSKPVNARDRLTAVGVPHLTAAEDRGWLIGFLRAFEQRLLDDARMAEVVRQLRFEARQRLQRTVVRQLAALVTAVTILSASSVVAAVWLLTHW